MADEPQRFDIGWLVIGVVVLGVGIWYFLSNTLGWNLGDLNGDAIWPILVIAVGASILVRVWRSSTHHT